MAWRGWLVFPHPAACNLHIRKFSTAAPVFRGPCARRVRAAGGKEAQASALNTGKAVGDACGVQRIPRLPETLPLGVAPHLVPPQPPLRLLVQPGVHAGGSRSGSRRCCRSCCHPCAASSQVAEAGGLPFRPGRERRRRDLRTGGGGAEAGGGGAGRTGPGKAVSRRKVTSSASLPFTRALVGGRRAGSVDGEGKEEEGWGSGGGVGGGPG